MRQIILDTETTGLSPKKGDRIVEICALEMIDRELTGNKFHTYLQPSRWVPDEVIRIHGLTNEFLCDKPRFAAVWFQFHEFINNAQIIAHNAQFDMSFIINEFELLMIVNPFINNIVICTKEMSKQKYGSGGNRLDDLCDRFGINREDRKLHSAEVDCQLLAQVYLKLTEEIA